MTYTKGFTLIELIVALGLFAIVMTISSGAYLMMIGLNQQSQGMAVGIDNLSFALETMSRSIRTGTGYSCNGGDCPNGSNTFSFTNDSGRSITYSLAGNTIEENIAGSGWVPLTDPSVKVTTLEFYAVGTKPTSAGDYEQPHVTIVVSGSVSSGHGKSESFSIETGATMRGVDL